MSTEKQTPPIPEWLTEMFLKECIKNDVGVSAEEVAIKDFKINYAIPKGENYSSVILRLLVNADISNAVPTSNSNMANGSKGHDNRGQVKQSENKNMMYVIKAIVTQDVLTDFLNELEIFTREVDMYNRVVPNFQKLLKEAGLPTTFICRCLHYEEENQILVMDDLKANGYQLADRIRGADLEHTKTVVRKIARFHAASMKYYEQNTYKDVPAYYYKYIICHIEDDKVREAMDGLLGRTLLNEKIALLADTLSKVSGYEKEAQLIKGFIDSGFDILCDTYKYKPGNVFNGQLHGDCWLNNMMFKYDDSGKPVDVLFLDLQCSTIASVTNELMQFLLTSASDDVRQFHYDYVVKFYYDNLTETLETLGYKGMKPTFQQLQEEILVSSSIFLWLLGLILPVIKAQFKDAGDRSKEKSIDFAEMTQLADQNHSNPIFEKTLLITINMLRKIGVFEYHDQLLKSYKK